MVTAQVAYDGVPLDSGTRIWWHVRCWDERGKASPWSEPAFFETGLLHKEDWRGQWLGIDNSRSPLFRRTFTLTRPVKRARAHVCGLGFYELHLNGAKIGDQVLAPNWTNFDQRRMRRLAYPFDDQTRQRVLYASFDVNDTLKKGANAAGVWLGNGWYNQRERLVEGQLWYDTPRFLLQLNIEFEDGTTTEIVSDPSWRFSPSHLIENNIFRGEIADARLEQTGWDRARFDDSAWKPAAVVRAPTGRLMSRWPRRTKSLSAFAR
jgi:alpha-L-rhamnosidase